MATSGTPCRAASGVCDVAESCDGIAKTCPANGFVTDGTPCGDGQYCNGDETCQSGACAAGTNPCALGCDESLDQCLTGACPLAAQTCRTAAKGLLLLKNKDDSAKDQLLWKWIAGASTTGAEFGDPRTDADYALCVYTGGAGSLAAEIDVAAGSQWTAAGSSGFKYYDSAATTGAQRIGLKGSAANKSKILFKGRGAALPDLIDSAAANLPVTVQLLNQRNGQCWGSTFTTASPNDTSRLKARLP